MEFVNYPLSLLSEHHKHGFSINTNILETNVINIAILLTALIYFGKPTLNKILQNRQDKVLFAINEAETKLEQANTRLTQAEKQLQQTQAIIAQIKQEAESTAAKIRASILAQGKIDVDRLVASSTSSVFSTEADIRKQIQQQIATLALKRVSAQLKAQISSEMQSKIIDLNIAKLGGK
uniref:ATP synthase CFO B subunit subunit I n=1 Tax=Porphyridium aerugineum TaxID=2792 RepID=UPI001FCDE343|nr:ATP synthase CFO B subunit subunit I [Porphyridium aerugineum]UNJ17964.1 ATP synthase CFO B subunit subunit I [Porphyridium aerugineum]